MGGLFLVVLALLCVLVLGCFSRLVSGQPGSEASRVTIGMRTTSDTAEITPKTGGAGRVQLIGVGHRR